MVAWHLCISRDTACRYGVTASEYRNKSLKSGRGCVMKERNQKQRRHIRAARQWLGEAEHSLAENHRVRGELKVMLAKAELARVEGTPGHRFVKKWSMRILPALAAIFLAGGGYALWQAQLPHNAAVPAPVETEAPEPSPALPAETADEPPLAPIEIPEQAQPAAAPAQAAPAPSSEPVPAQAAAPSEAQPAAPPRESAPRVPDDGMQKLMQTAGKALRK